MTEEPIDERVRLVSGLLKMHAGGIELEDVDDAGRVTVRFTGMCTGCLYRPVTMAATIKPALTEVEGVTDVVAVGSRMSAEAERRLEEDLGSWWRELKSEQPRAGS